jgi:glyoxylase-like metal-dependent hydrolase (beta-lactamase superfamily II)
MLVHHLNCATMCPTSARLVNGRGGYLERGEMVCHCLLVETAQGLALVDTGLGLADLAAPRTNLGSSFLFFVAPKLDPEETAVRQVVRLGYRAEDVRHVIVTHLDVDHAGGLPDFPKARVHVYASEHAAAMQRSTLVERERYRPVQWEHGPQWVLHQEAGERWFGFACVREVIPGADLLLVPLFGHTRGHVGVAVKTPDTWLLHAGDAYFFHGELEKTPRCTPALAAFQRLIAMDNSARIENQGRLRELNEAHAGEVTIFSAHDPVELAHFTGLASKRRSAA